MLEYNISQLKIIGDIESISILSIEKINKGTFLQSPNHAFKINVKYKHQSIKEASALLPLNTVVYVNGRSPEIHDIIFKGDYKNLEPYIDIASSYLDDSPIKQIIRQDIKDLKYEDPLLLEVYRFLTSIPNELYIISNSLCFNMYDKLYILNNCIYKNSVHETLLKLNGIKYSNDETNSKKELYKHLILKVVFSDPTTTVTKDTIIYQDK